MEAELAHLDNREWLFSTKERSDDPYYRSIGKSVVRLYNHTRNCIRITACANNTVRERIEEKKAAGGDLVSYLSQARWIHSSSLSDFNQFEANIRDVMKAKEMNPMMKVSIDPGFEFTSKHRERLRPLMKAADYVFLNKREKANLGGNAETEEELYRNLSEFFAGTNCTLIVKYDNKHDVIRFEDGKPVIRTICHNRLDIKEINNDTGAGDSLAGGFIAGMLDERTNGDIEGPIALGVLAAKGRMTCFDSEDPYLKIQKMADEYFAKLNE